jgi:SAM-dependent methyltransferase
VNLGLPVPCPVCAETTADAGPTVHALPARVAGVPIDLGRSAARMRACPACGVRFKHPFVPEADLLACYADAPGDNWEHDPDPVRRRFDTIAALTASWSPGRRVLDVGCSNGALLAYFGEDWARFGLEPGAEAARVAAGRGVTVLGGTLADLDPLARFDAILAIDVLEHVTDPSGFLLRVARHLAPAGVFVGLTGDSDAWGWRLQGNAYWYAALPEHQVFYRRRTIERLAALHTLRPEAFRRTSHARHKPGRVLRDGVRGVAFGAARRLGVFRTRPGPGWLPARDHMLFVLRGPGTRAEA